MLKIWVLIFFVINSDGSANVVLRLPPDSKMNTQKYCQEKGQLIGDQLQAELDEKGARVYFDCEPISVKDITKLYLEI